jgi:hypothetical protein
MTAIEGRCDRQVLADSGLLKGFSVLDLPLPASRIAGGTRNFLFFPVAMSAKGDART